MRATRFYILLSLIVPLALPFSCRYDKADEICIVPEQVSFSRDIIPMLNTDCNTSGCHSGSAPAGNLDLSPAVAYTNLMNPGSGYVDTLHPQYSLFYGQLRSTSDPMPPTGRLSDCKIEMVLRWIQQKAKNN